MLHEGLLLRIGVGMASLSAQDIGRYVVVGIEAIGGADAGIDQFGHCLVEIRIRVVPELLQFLAVQGFAHGQVHPALGLGNARQNAVQVLSRLFDIRLTGTLGIEFQGLELIARLPFVGDGQRSDVQLFQGLYAVFPARKVEHLDNSLVRQIHTVFGTAVSLGNPHALFLLGNGVADVFRHVLALEQEIPGRCHRSGPLDAEHLVAPAYVDDHLPLHQVGSESNLRGPSARITKQHLQESRVHHDIPVVGDKEVVFSRIQALHSGDSKTVGGFVGDGVNHLIHHPHLEFLHRAATAQHNRHFLHGCVREQEIADQREILVGHNPLHGSRNLRIYVRPDIVKHVWLVYQ